MGNILRRFALLIAITGAGFFAYEPLNDYADSLRAESYDLEDKAHEESFEMWTLPDGTKRRRHRDPSPNNPLYQERDALREKAASIEDVAAWLPTAGTALLLVGCFCTGLGLIRLQRGKSATDGAEETPVTESSTQEVTHV